MLESGARAILDRLSDEDLVLDVGGWADPFVRADWVLDLMPYETRGSLRRRARGARPERALQPATWVQRDICDREPWPFADEQFDFAICAQTLEDVRDPVWAAPSSPAWRERATWRPRRAPRSRLVDRGSVGGLEPSPLAGGGPRRPSVHLQARSAATPGPTSSWRGRRTTPSLPSSGWRRCGGRVGSPPARSSTSAPTGSTRGSPRFPRASARAPRARVRAGAPSRAGSSAAGERRTRRYGPAMAIAEGLEPEIQRIGRELAAAFPGGARNPLKALDDRAMELASRDAELRAALFRFVDVTPACRSLDDLARHLTGYLDEVDERPPPHRRGDAHGRHASRGARRWARRPPPGVRHMAHRFIVGESPAATRSASCAALWNDGAASSVDLLGEATSPPTEADRYAAALPRGARDPGRGRAAAGPSGPRSRRDSHGPLAAREPLGEGLGADARCCAPRRPSVGQRRRRARACAPLLRRARELGAHLHIDMESLDSREAVIELVLELLGEQEFARRALGRHRAAGLPARLAASSSSASSTGLRERARARRRSTVRLVKGAYWDHEIVEARQHGWTAAGVRGQGRLRPQLRGAHAPPARRAPARARGDRLAQPALGRARDRLQPRDRRRRPRPRAPGAARPRRRARSTRSPRSGLRVRTYCPVGDLVAGHGLPRAPAAGEHLQRVVPRATQARGAPLDELLGAPP